VALAMHFSRRADVLNRGLSGYNTRWGLQALDSCLPPHASTELATVWFGANDAADAALNPRQHVPLDEYKRNLTAIVERIQKRCKNVVVLSPPPIHEATYRSNFIEPRQGKGAPLDRTLEASKTYATAAGEVAASAGCAFIDVWSKFQVAASAASGSDEQPWGKLFYDGLHLSDEGNRLLFKELLGGLRDCFPDLLVEPCRHTGKQDNSGSISTALLPHLPWHDAISLENQGSIFQEAADGGFNNAKRPRTD
jgi:lysophospholipase L1-like esterase